MISIEVKQAELAAQLTLAGIDTARLDARLLMQYALDSDDTALMREARRELLQHELTRIEALAARRLQREPMAQIVGMRAFWKDEFCVSPDVLTPRPDSETLIEAMLEARADTSKPYDILDLGIGSGCLMLSLLREYPQAAGVAIDRSEQALQVARHNAKRLKLASRLIFLCADWMQTLQTQYDMIITNPPYIDAAQMARLEPEVKQFEPEWALSGGGDGLCAYRQILMQAPACLRPDGVMVLELGEGQRTDVQAIAQEHGLEVVTVRKDLAGLERAMVVRRQ